MSQILVIRGRDGSYRPPGAYVMNRIAEADVFKNPIMQKVQKRIRDARMRGEKAADDGAEEFGEQVASLVSNQYGANERAFIKENPLAGD